MYVPPTGGAEGALPSDLDHTQTVMSRFWTWLFQLAIFQVKVPKTCEVVPSSLDGGGRAVGGWGKGGWVFV